MPSVKEITPRQILTEQFTNAGTMRQYLVSELTEADPAVQVAEALSQTEIPKWYDFYLTTPQALVYPAFANMRVTERQAEALGSNKARVEITYSNLHQSQTSSAQRPLAAGEDYTEALKEVSSTIVQRKAFLDQAGQPMTIPPPTGYAGASGYPDYQVEVEVPFVIGIITFTRTERLPPSEKVRDFRAKLNSDVLGPYGVGEVYCANITGDTRDNGGGYRTVFEFHHADAEYWQHEDIYRTKQGQQIASAAPVYFDVLERREFTSLDLDWLDKQDPV